MNNILIKLTFIIIFFCFVSQLRLNAGWSCHTKSTLKKDSQLTESELIEIQKVLQRSEMVEKTERNRVS